jgi:ribosomal protein L37AE/L43A
MSPEETEGLSQTYFSAFKAYKDNEIQEAADDYATSGEYFPPKPAQILSLVKNVDQSKHNRELTEHWTCSMCKQKVSSITSDGVCLDCCGVPMPAYQSIKPLPNSTSRHYRMEGRMQCQTCGNVGMCIKEPADSGSWECRQCYTRMNNKEIAAAFRTLGEMVGEARETGPRETDPSLH